MRTAAIAGVVALALTVASGHAQPTTATAQTKRPNIIYFFADDLGYGDTGPYGQKKIHTPNIDRLAAEGMRFTHHYTGAPVCAPSRCMLLTGLHSGHSFIRGNYEFGGFEDEKEGGQMPLPPETYTLGRMLKQQGYATACVGKWGLGMTQSAGHPNRQGFDYFFGYLDQKQAHTYYPTHLWENENRYALENEWTDVHAHRGTKDWSGDFDRYQQGDHATDHITSKALSFLDRSKGSPFFLYYATPVPHVSLQPRQEFLERYIKEFGEEAPYLGSKGYTPHKYPRAAYAAMVSQMDDDLGKLMAKLKEIGEDENTIIMFSSDNGPTTAGGVDLDFFNSAAGLRGQKGEVYEGGIRVPMIARWPGHVKAGSVSSHRSAQYDVLPTLAEALNVKLGHHVDGISFLPTLLGDANQRRHDYMYWEFPEKGGQVAITKGEWKAVRTGVRENINAPWQLYSLSADEKESTDVAAQHRDVVAELDALARESHWQPVAREWEFINPKFEAPAAGGK